MHILVVHNRYRSTSPSGENVVVDQEIQALRAAGHRVSTYLRTSDELAAMSLAGKLAAAPSPVHSRTAVRDVARLLHDDRPDVMHLHNPYPLVSMSVVRAAGRAGVPVVQTVHNYRHTCMKGTYERDGRRCTDCLQARSPLPGVVHACYRGSRAQSAVMATALLRHRSTAASVSRFVAISDVVRDSLLDSGIGTDRVVVKPNAVADPGPAGPLGEGFAYIGRLSPEKGVADLLSAWDRHPDGAFGPLTVVGDGPLADAVRRLATRRTDVEALGRLDPADVQEVLRRTSAVVVPSRWEEPLGLVVLEAMAAARPLLVTDRGALPGLVGPASGRVVPVGADSISRGLEELASHPDLLEGWSKGARAAYDETYRPDVITQRLVDIYRDVLRSGQVAAG